MLTLKDKIKAVQRGINAYPDGLPGEQTWDCLYRQFATPDMPYRVEMFGQWTFFSDIKKVLPFNPSGKAVRNFSNCISGSFTWNRKPVSIMISNGSIVHGSACHSWIKDRNGKPLPESVLWYNKNGTYGVSQVAYAYQLPDFDNIVWAVGGAGLQEGDASKEGFVGAYSDVFRRTSHIVIGVDSFGYFVAVEALNLSGNEIKTLIGRLGLTHYILLDGGSVTATNVDGRTYNTSQAQYYAIQLR